MWFYHICSSLRFLYLSLFKQVGSFFMINLCLVVIATQFSETKQRENALMREQRARYMSNDSTLASYSEPGSCYEEMLRYISHLYRKLTRRLQRIYSGWHRYVTGCFFQVCRICLGMSNDIAINVLCGDVSKKPATWTLLLRVEIDSSKIYW